MSCACKAPFNTPDVPLPEPFCLWFAAPGRMLQTGSEEMGRGCVKKMKNRKIYAMTGHGLPVCDIIG